MNNQQQQYPSQQQDSYSPLLKGYADIKEKNSAVLGVMNYANHYSKMGFLEKLNEAIGIIPYFSGSNEDRKYVNDFAKRNNVATFSPYTDIPYLGTGRYSNQRAITLSVQENARSSLERLYEQSIMEGDFRTARDAMNQLKVVREMPIYSTDGTAEHRSMQKLLLDISEKSSYKVVSPVNTRVLQSFYRNSNISDTDAIINGALSSIYWIFDRLHSASKVPGMALDNALLTQGITSSPLFPNTHLPTPSWQEMNAQGLDDRSLTISNAISAGSLYALCFMSAPTTASASALSNYVGKAIYTGVTAEVIPNAVSYVFDKGVDALSADSTDNQKEAHKQSIFKDLFTIGVQQQYHKYHGSRSGGKNIRNRAKSGVGGGSDFIIKNAEATEANATGGLEAGGMNQEGVNQTSVISDLQEIRSMEGAIDITDSGFIDTEQYTRSVIDDLSNIVPSDFDRIPSSYDQYLDFISNKFVDKLRVNPVVVDAINNNIPMDILPLSGNMLFGQSFLRNAMEYGDPELTKESLTRKHKQAVLSCACLVLTNGDKVMPPVPDNNFTTTYESLKTAKEIGTAKANELYDLAENSIDLSSLNMELVGTTLTDFSKRLAESYSDMSRKVIGTVETGDGHGKSVHRFFKTSLNKLEDMENRAEVYPILKDIASEGEKVVRSFSQDTRTHKGKYIKALRGVLAHIPNIIDKLFGRTTYELHTGANSFYRGLMQTGINDVLDFLIPNTVYDKKQSIGRTNLDRIPSKNFIRIKDFAISCGEFSPQEIEQINSKVDEASSDCIKFRLANKYSNQDGIKPDLFRNRILKDNVMMDFHNSNTRDPSNTKLNLLVDYVNYSSNFYSGTANPSGTAQTLQVLAEDELSKNGTIRFFKRVFKDPVYKQVVIELINNPTIIRAVLNDSIQKNKQNNK